MLPQEHCCIQTKSPTCPQAALAVALEGEGAGQGAAAAQGAPPQGQDLVARGVVTGLDRARGGQGAEGGARMTPQGEKAAREVLLAAAEVGWGGHACFLEVLLGQSMAWQYTVAPYVHNALDATAIACLQWLPLCKDSLQKRCSAFLAGICCQRAGAGGGQGAQRGAAPDGQCLCEFAPHARD